MALGNEDRDLALVSHAEGMERRHEVRAKQGRDAFALEETLHHERLGLVAAMHLDEAALPRGLAGPAWTGERYDLGAFAHGPSLNR
jgi:hypothetical protein